jgi:hypothetical protein
MILDLEITPRHHQNNHPDKQMPAGIIQTIAGKINLDWTKPFYTRLRPFVLV